MEAVSNSHCWQIKMSSDDYAQFMPEASDELKHLRSLAMHKPRVSTYGVLFEFWGKFHLEMAKEVCRTKGFFLED